MNRKNIIISICVAAAVLLLATVLIVTLSFGSSASADTDNPDIKAVGITELLDTVKELKNELKSLIKDIKNEKFEEAKDKVDSIQTKIIGIRKLVDKFTKIVFIPGLRGQVENVGNILKLAEYALNEVADPAIDQLSAYPLSSLSTEAGINAALLCDYLDFVDSIMPKLSEMLRLANGLDLSLVDGDGTISGYLELANSMLESYREDPEVLGTIKSMLGAEGDRFYLLVAQNSAEIRASGGFPGSIGTIRIHDGIMEIGDFNNVYAVLHTFTPGSANVTAQENHLFHRGLLAPRDADYCPDFERVADIWALGYEAKMGQHVDGVISLTPVVIQKLLAATGQEVTLSDGTVLNGENATRVLQYELYIKYYGKEYVSGRDETSDALFAETAKVVLNSVLKKINLGLLPDYLEIVKEGFGDRTIMMWMEDAKEQELARTMGASGALNYDPMKPEAGVYYNCRVPSKLGWYLTMDTTMGERVKNADGSYTYPITVVLNNAMTQEDKNASGFLLLGGTGGNIMSSVYFFAPAGGTISNIKVTDNLPVIQDVYKDLQVGFIETFYIAPNKPITITYNVTTAPGAEEMLTFSTTPTLQEYH